MSEESAKKLREEFARSGLDAPIPAPILRRMDLIAQGQERVWWSALTRYEQRRASTGTATLFTERSVIRASWRDVPLFEHFQDDSTASVTMWSRRLLELVAIPEQDDRGVPPNQVWSQDFGEGWPPHGTIELVYRSPGTTLRLPDIKVISNQLMSAKFREFVSSLHLDLTP